MRSPISDANAGAVTDIAPTKKHAVRTAAVARQNSNGALNQKVQINKLASQLGTALGTFMEGKRVTEAEQRYQKAYHDQGTAEGLTEYQRDLKRTGFTEFIYGGQSPEYKGALDASARNASNAMYIEEQAFIEGEGGDLTPEQYQTRVQEKIRSYNEENFSDAPDGAFAFMKNWQDNSNELSKQHVKLFNVRQQQQARQTVAEGWQTDLDMYKTMVSTNPDKAAQMGRDMFSGKYKPVGMSDTAYREVLVSESLTAARAHDFSALKLLNDSGLVSTFNDKELKNYEAVRGIIDQDNFNMMESARLDYETTIENPLSTSREVAQARQRYDTSIAQTSARNTGTSKHLKTTFGADRWRGVLGNQYQAQLKKEATAGQSARVDAVTATATAFQVDMFSAEPSQRRGMLADRLDSLQVVMFDPTLDPEIKEDLQKQFLAGKKQLEGWESELDTRTRKENEIQEKRDLEERELATGVESLVTGGGFVAGDAKTQKQHLQGAVSSVVNQINPDPDMNTIDKLEGIVGTPDGIYKLIKGAGQFNGYLADAPEIQTAITNLAVNLRGELSEDNTFTDSQRSNAAALEVLKEQSPQLFNASFSADERVELAYMQNAIKTKKGVAESVRILDTIAQQVDTKTVLKLNGEDVATRVGASGAPPDVQNAIYTEYRNHLPLGHDAALEATQSFANGINTRAGGTTVRYGSTFEPIEGKNLDATMKVLSKTYKSGGVYKSGYTRALASLIGGSVDESGNELYSLKQVPGVKVSVFQGGIMLELNGRVQMIQRPELEAEINGYDEWYKGTESIRSKSWWDRF